MTDLSAWPSAKHFTSWLCLAPSNKISGGKVLSSRTRRSGNRAPALLRLAATTVGRTDTALGAFYRRLLARIGKAKAVTANARKIAVLLYNAVRHGMEYVDPGASFYETRYRARVIDNLHRRARAFGFVLQPIEPAPGIAAAARAHRRWRREQFMFDPSSAGVHRRNGRQHQHGEAAGPLPPRWTVGRRRSSWALEHDHFGSRPAPRRNRGTLRDRWPARWKDPHLHRTMSGPDARPW
jgi:Transposase IS116/IS110/IS902 family